MVAHGIRRRFCRAIRCIFFAGLLAADAQESRPLLGPGATRDEVIDAYGWPTGQSKLGSREILSYPQGTVTLQDGRVESMAFTMKPPWPPPRPRPAWAVPAAREPERRPEVPPTRSDETVREAPKPPPRVEEAPAPAKPESRQAPPAAGPSASGKTVELISTLFRARWVLATTLTLGIGLTAFFFWVVWHRWSPARLAPEGEMTVRISDAASGLPSQLDLPGWPRERLVVLVGAFLEAEGYHPEVQPAGGDKDIVLRRAPGERPHLLILCAGSETGSLAVKGVREFFATMTADGVDAGWYVAPAGFSAEAKEFAGQHGVQLIDGPGLTAQLRELPPLVLPKVLAKAAAWEGTRRR